MRARARTISSTRTSGCAASSASSRPAWFAPEAQMALLLSMPRPASGAKRSQPLFGQQAEGAVAQRHHGVAAPQRRQQLGQAHRGVVVIHLAVQLEPVDSGAHVHRAAPGAPEALPSASTCQPA